MKLFVSLCFLVSVGVLQAQSFLGVHSSNYDPIRSGSFNPATPATSLMKWEVSLVGLNFHAAQNYLKFQGGLGGFGDDGFDKDENLQENLNGNDKEGNISIDIPAIGFVFNKEKVGAISLLFRTRTIIDAKGVDEGFISSIYNDFNNIYNWANQINDTEFNINAHAFSEIALGYSRKVWETENHKVTAGGTAKLLIPGFSGKVDGVADFDITNTTANFGNSVVSAISSDALDAIDNEDGYNPNFKIAGFGFDLGAVYEWKKDIGDTKIIGKNKNKGRVRPNYFLKAGFAILDIGNVSYQHSNYSRVFRGDNTTVDLNDITAPDSTFLDFDQVLNALGDFTEFEGSYKTKLPLAMTLFADVRLTRTIYVNASAYINMGDFSEFRPKARAQSIYSITPRFELPQVGVYVPMAYNVQNGFELGASFRFSNFIIGSSNILSYLWNNETSSIDIQFAMAFGGIDKSKKKAAKEKFEEDKMLLEGN